MPHANSAAMQHHLDEIAQIVAPGAHGLIVLDQAAWHTTQKLRLPDNLSLLPLPPKSPELNPAENVWEFLRRNKLSNLIFEGYDPIVAAACDAWNSLIADPDRIASIGTPSLGSDKSSLKRVGISRAVNDRRSPGTCPAGQAVLQALTIVIDGGGRLGEVGAVVEAVRVDRRAQPRRGVADRADIDAAAPAQQELGGAGAEPIGFDQ